jgi:hypothetical protein
MDNLGFLFLAAILLIQVYKIARPILPKLGISENTLNAADKALGFVYDVVPGIYRAVEALTKKGRIKPEAKWVEFLKLLNEQAVQEGVELTNQARARAELIVKDLAARDHQPGTVAGTIENQLNPSPAPATEASQ